jgi:outer membrane protein assembly factor BamD (BamD/ComL family)
MFFRRNYKLILTILVVFSLAGCYPWHWTSLRDVRSAEKALQVAQKDGKLNSKVINNAITTYHFFVMYFPYDTLTPGFFYREGELYQMDGQYKKAISTLNSFEKLYPKSWHVPDAVFLMATIDEQNIKDQDSADTLYAKLLFNYPDSKAAQKTHDLLESKGISSEDFYKKYAKAFLKSGNSEKADSTQQSVRYHAYWKRQ